MGVRIPKPPVGISRPGVGELDFGSNSELIRLIRNLIKAMPNELASAIIGDLVVKGELQLSPRAIAYLQDLLTATPTSVATDSIWDAKGDLVAGTGADAAARLAVGSDGQGLKASSAEGSGLVWAGITQSDVSGLTTALSGKVDVTIADAKGDLIVASGADAVSRLAVGSNGQVLTADSAQTLGVKWAAAASVSLTTGSGNVASNVTMTTANTYYDGPSVSLAAGTWLIVGTVTIVQGGASGRVSAKLWDGTTVESSASTELANSEIGPITVSGIVTLGSTTTMKISAASAVASAQIKASAAIDSAVHASHIRAIKVA